MIRVANAPCSWGVLEFDAAEQPAPASQVLDEMAAAGYAGTELGDWGFLPTDAGGARGRRRRGAQLALVGAFVPVALARADALDEGIARAVRTARLLRATRRAGRTRSLVLSDDNASVPNRTARAGRIRAEDGLTDVEWDGFARARRADRGAVRDATGLRTVFHHHCAGYVETPQEIDALLSRTDPALLGSVPRHRPPDVRAAATRSPRSRPTAIASGTCTSRTATRRWRAARSRRLGLSHRRCAAASSASSVAARCRSPACSTRCAPARYDGWIVVEQDVLPGLGTPAASATRNREYLRGLGI